MQEQSADDVARWLAACEAVVESREQYEDAWRAHVVTLIAAHDAGATWEDLAYAARMSRTTIRRWVNLTPSRSNVMASPPSFVRLADVVALPGVDEAWRATS